MLKKRLLTLGLVGLILIVFLVVYKTSKTGGTMIVKINNTEFSVKIADNNKERARGLMHRDNLKSDEGMLFIFDKEGIYSFWMKNTLIPLDMLWINENLEIVDIKTASPCLEANCPLFKPQDKAMYVLEINAEQAQQKDINIGDKVLIIK